MNKEKQIEQLKLAIRIIREGLEWEWKNEALEIMEWIKARDGLSPSEFCHDEYEIRIKPQPDPYEALKKAHAEGKTIEYRCDEYDNWGIAINPCWTHFGDYRIKPEPDKWDELKKAHKEGKEIQYYDAFAKKWFTTHSPSFVHGDFRLKPEPVKVPLGPDDVPSGSVLYYKTWGSKDKVAWVSVIQVTESNGILVAETNPKWYSFQDLIDNFQINRSIPLTGKWNPAAWEPCYKEVE